MTVLNSLAVFGDKTSSSHVVLAKFRSFNVRISPYKLRRISQILDKRSLPYSVALLRNLVTPSSLIFAKALRAAVASITESYVAGDVLVRCVVDEGFVFKTHKPAGRGRLHRIRKRCSHVTLCLVRKGR